MLTPAIEGRDGISMVTRQALAALWPGVAPLESLEIWSLTGAAVSGFNGSRRDVRVRNASGSKWKFIGYSATAATRQDLRQTLILTLHLHLAPAALPLAIRGARVAIFLHGIEAWKRLSPLEGAAARRADVIISNSRYTAARFRAANAAIDREIVVCPLGVPRGEIRIPDEVGLPDPGFALIVGRMAATERYKGHDMLLEVWPQVVADYPGARLVIVGEGDDRARLISKASVLNLNDGVRFLGSVPDDTLLALYQRSAFLVMPSSGEGFGLVFVEAMRSAKPCIGARGAAEEIIDDEDSGLIVEADNKEELRRAVLRLFRDPCLRLQMGKQSAMKFEQEFTIDRFGRRLRTALGFGTAAA